MTFSKLNKKNWKVHAGEMHHSHLWGNKKHTKFTNKNKTNKKIQIQSVQTKMQMIRKKENWKQHALGVDTKLQKVANLIWLDS